jgi:hypothetical protein
MRASPAWSATARLLVELDPPPTNQSGTFQSGYYPKQYNVMARFVYASITYAFGGPKDGAE